MDRSLIDDGSFSDGSVGFFEGLPQVCRVCHANLVILSVYVGPFGVLSRSFWGPLKVLFGSFEGPLGVLWESTNLNPVDRSDGPFVDRSDGPFGVL